MSAAKTSPPLRIDTHHHFWHYDPEEYGWITDAMTAIRQDFLPEHLLAEIRACGIHGAISVQVRQTLEESRWLLELASQHNWIKGVVGWVPLTAAEAHDTVGALAGRGPLKAVRHILQEEPDEAYMLRDDFNRGIDCLLEFGISYDILIFERHLPQTIEFVDRHPQQIFILDHVAKPRIRDHLVSPWRENLRKLAERPNVFCKISGMVTEADSARWTEEDLKPYFQIALECFGPQRLMFGSDWPVCLVATTYRDWAEYVSRQIATLSESEQDAIRGGTAIRAYRLKADPQDAGIPQATERKPS